MIKLGVIGLIKSGDDAGQYIKVEHDPDATGGYYIFQSDTPQFHSDEGYDAWVETFDSVASFFKESSWVIDWNINILPANAREG